VEQRIQLRDLAAELGITTDETIAHAVVLGIHVMGPYSSLVEAEADLIRRSAGRDGLTRAKQPRRRKVRLWEVAKELGMTNDEAIALAVKLGMPVRSSSSSIWDAEADRLRRVAEREGLTRVDQPKDWKREFKLLVREQTPDTRMVDAVFAKWQIDGGAIERSHWRSRLVAHCRTSDLEGARRVYRELVDAGIEMDLFELARIAKVLLSSRGVGRVHDMPAAPVVAETPTNDDASGGPIRHDVSPESDYW